MSDTAEQTKNLTLIRVKQIVSQVFEIEETDFDLDLSPDNVDSWDSFGQLSLIDSIEREFGITFEIEEVFNIVCVRDICDMLEKKKII